MNSSPKLIIMPRRRRSSSAQDVLLPGEDQAEYEALEAQLFRDFAPQDALSEELVRDVAALMWKKKRLQRSEQRILAKALVAPLTEDEDIPMLRAVWPLDVQRRVVELALAVQVDEILGLYNTYRFAERLLRQDTVSLDDLNAMEAHHPALWQPLATFAAPGHYFRWAELLFGRGQPAATENSSVDTGKILVAMTHRVCGEFLCKYAELPLLLAESQNAYEVARAVQAERVMNANTSELRRAAIEVDRALSRTLDALRKHSLNGPAIIDVSALKTRARYKTD